MHARWSKKSLKHSVRFCGIFFFSSLTHYFLAKHSSKVSSGPDCIFEIHQLWQHGCSRVYSNSYCRCSFEPKIIKISQSSHNLDSNNIVNSQESRTILNACTKKVWELIQGKTYIYIYIYISFFYFLSRGIIYIYVYIYIYIYKVANFTYLYIYIYICKDLVVHTENIYYF